MVKEEGRTGFACLSLTFPSCTLTLSRTGPDRTGPSPDPTLASSGARNATVRPMILDRMRNGTGGTLSSLEFRPFLYPVPRFDIATQTSEGAGRVWTCRGKRAL